MKSLKLIICLCLAIATTSLTAQKRENHDRDGKRIEKMTEALNLSDAQASKMTELFSAYQQQFKAVKDDTGLAKEAKKAKMKSLKADLDAKTKSVLTSDQYAKFAEMKTERKENKGEKGKRKGHGKKHDGKGKGKKIDKMAAQLNLTERQTSDLETVFSTYKEKAKALRQDEALDKEAKRAQLDKLKALNDEKVRGILNADQYQKYVELKADRKENKKGKRKMKAKDQGQKF